MNTELDKEVVSMFKKFQVIEHHSPQWFGNRLDVRAWMPLPLNPNENYLMNIAQMLEPLRSAYQSGNRAAVIDALREMYPDAMIETKDA